MRSHSGDDLTQGNLSRTLLTFAFPFLLANLIQALYGAVDLIIIGQFSDASAIAAVSIGTQVMQILTSLVAGLTMGGTILTAQYFGAQKKAETSETIRTTLTMFGAAGLLFTVLMLFCASPILRLLQTPPSAFESAYGYVTACSFGILFIFGYNAVSAILRGLGDSKRPLIFIGVACVSNILLDLLLVGGLHMGAVGAAVATVLSQGLSLLLSVLYLKRKEFPFDFKMKSFGMDKRTAQKLLRVGVPVSLQETVVNLSFLFISAIVNSLGVVTAAAVGICGKFDAFAMLPAGAFSGALATMTAQNMGAGQPKRAKKALNTGILCAFLASLVFLAWAQLAPESILKIFKADAAVAVAGAQYLRSFSIDFSLVAFVFCYNGFFNGCGHTRFTMINGVLSTVMLRVPIAYLMSLWVPNSLVGIGAAAPIASAVSILASLLYLRLGKWKRIDKG